jgi:chromosomal replication initiation ATPase DnaA
MIQVFAGRIPSGRALAVKVEPPISVEVSPPDGASIPCAEEEAITAADLRQALVRAFPLMGRKSIANIQIEVAQFYGLHPDHMISSERTRRVAHPRQAAMYLCRALTKASLPDIGNRFGGRDHTTVIHALKAVEKRADADPLFGLELEVLRERLSA